MFDPRKSGKTIRVRLPFTASQAQEDDNETGSVDETFALGQTFEVDLAAACEPFEVGDVTNMYTGSITAFNSSDLIPLIGYDGMTGSLGIYGDLSDFSALSSLKYVGGSVDFEGIYGSFAGLDNLTTIEGYLFMNLQNSSPSDWSPFNKLHRVSGGVYVRGVSGTMENAFPCIDTLSQFALFSSPSLTSFAGLLSGLTEITSSSGDDLLLSNLPAVTNASGAFPALVTTQDIRISNVGVTTFAGSFAVMTTVVYGFILQSCANITDVSSFETVDGGNFDPGANAYVQDCPSLSTANANALINHWIGEGAAFGGGTDTSGNGP